ncbi:hypothetical protein ACM39_17675 [Chryseobacterium sp. FH2]|uniref:hypothetical protein n=1 Tax=Chryseobacterium sp. FH2 TaxID=1674291 RepID=UPI00065AA939|nr:hypothetical protein [Chryseobacterium sp. FH2]KMQ62937.1 hypothetical protein ACM39_17675 [Chryseobacterium sp. FH2]
MLKDNLPLRISYGINKSNPDGLHGKTILIDSVGNSLYYNSGGNPYNWKKQEFETTDSINAINSLLNCSPYPTFKGRYNYYDNVRRTKKK